MNTNLDKAVTARFTYQEHLSILSEAGKRGSSVAEVIRSSWRHYQQQRELKQLLLRMEQRQRSDYFKILCSVLNLSDDEIMETSDTLKAKGVKL
jgi:hypothetical protein